MCETRLMHRLAGGLARRAFERRFPWTTRRASPPAKQSVVPAILLVTAILLATAICAAASDLPQINPVARPELSETVHEWTFDSGDEGWTAQNQCTVSSGGGLLKIQSAGDDPYLDCPVDFPGGQLTLSMRVRARAGGGGGLYWTTDQSPRRGEDKVARFPLDHDGQWHETSAIFNAPGRLRDVRIDPGTAPGEIEIDWIRLIRRRPHPLTIQRVERVGNQVRFEVENDSEHAVALLADGQAMKIDAGAAMWISRSAAGSRPLEAVSLELRTDEYPPLKRTVFVHHPEVQTEWIAIPSPQGNRGDVSVQVARDGSLALIRRNGVLVALLGPLVHCDGRLPELKPTEENNAIRFQGDGISVRLRLLEQELSVSIESDRPCEGPVVRAVGGLEQGLLAGLEYLGKGERSSSKLDIETDGHLRFAPDRLMVTMPLMSFVTDRSSVAMTWTDMQLQPVFATPNFFDGADDHRMALRGEQIDAIIRIDDQPLREAILWAVGKRGLPPLPQPPRTPEQQRQLCLNALNGPLRTEAGWGHCVQERWARQPFADMASTVWRLTDEVPELPRLVPGGAHVPNGSIYFVTGRAQEWLDHKTREVQGIMQRQQGDGSFRYDGEFRRGHFENTASGVCARPAATLLEYARVTGDEAALEAGLRALETMKRFRTPRGAQVWEVPLHTPDQLASAYLVWAYVRGYELTGKDEYLEHARKWAISGIPFVYLWESYPIMLYSTPPVFGATQWRHSWFGLPVQWVGGVYAYALTLLAPYDDSLDWNHLARGILISAEQQQYPDGPNAGLLPDSFNIPHQRRQPADINPCALLSLRMVLDGQLDFLSVAIEGKHRVAAPFPVTIRDGMARVEAKAGVEYQVIIDGKRIVDVKSQGIDVLPLE